MNNINEEIINKEKKGKLIINIFRGQNTYISVIIIAIILFIIFSLTVPIFFSGRNLINLLRRSSIDIIIACGMTMVLLIGQIDLSVPGMMAAVGMTTAMLLKEGLPVTLCIVVAFAMGIFMGFLNGYFSTKIPSFVVTLGMWSVAKGAALYVTNGVTIGNFPERFLLIERTTIFNIPIAAVYAIIITIIFLVLTVYTPFGRQLYAIGGNRFAALSSGTPVNRRIIQVFIIMGILSTIAALILVSKINAAVPFLYESASLNAIAAVVIGGTSLFGGKGHVIGSVAGAIIIVMLVNVFVLLGLPLSIQEGSLGVILIVVILLDYFRTRLSQR